MKAVCQAFAIGTVSLVLPLVVCAKESSEPISQKGPPAAFTKEQQAAITPKQALAELKAGNTRFVAGKMKHRNLKHQVAATALGQYPFASVVACIDSRAAPELVFDQGIGDIFDARIAGNFVNEDILGSLEFASKAAGSKLIVVMGHTSCGAIKGACDDVQLGNLTGMLGKIKPAVQSVPNDGTDRSSKNYKFVAKVAEANVKLAMLQIKEKSPVLKEMIDKGEVALVGAMYDISTGKVTWYE